MDSPTADTSEHGRKTVQISPRVPENGLPHHDEAATPMDGPRKVEDQGTAPHKEMLQKELKEDGRQWGAIADQK